MQVITAILLTGGSVALLLLILAFRAFRASWKVVYTSMLTYWFPHQARAQANENYIAKKGVIFAGVLLLLAAATFVGYWTFIIWAFSLD